MENENIRELRKEYIQAENELADLKFSYQELKELAENRGAFIDWVLENYPDIAKEYNGF